MRDVEAVNIVKALGEIVGQLEEINLHLSSIENQLAQK